MSTDTPADQRCRVVMCRGCCCGTTAKHPGFDHQAQAAWLAAIPASQAALTVSGCLGRCDDGNNIVVIPSPAGRRNGGTVVWLGRMLTPELTEAVTAWAAAGGPGIAPMPHILVPQRLGRPRSASSVAVG
jgi:(2Fe-2S) ferredoxin